MVSPSPDFAPDDERAEPFEASPVTMRTIVIAALAGLAPAAVLGALLWWRLS